MQWLEVSGAPMLARGESGCRPLATKVASAHLAPDGLRSRAADAIRLASARAGHVESIGTFSDPAANRDLAGVLGAAMGPRLRPNFEWYLCRGAFFHNDAHYSDVLFGIWYIQGPPVDIVFPRARLCLNVTPGNVIVFDPFEIHGVLHSGESQWEAERYADTAYSAFAGFEIALDQSVQALAGMDPAGDPGILSSATRISAATGSIDH